MTTLAEYLGDDDREALSRRNAIVSAWRAFEDGTARIEDATLIIRYIEHITAANSSPCIIDWIKNTQSAAGYEHYIAEHQARVRVYQQLMKLRDLADKLP